MAPRPVSPPGEPGPRVLVCAYACNPTLGSENAVGWDWVLAIARHHETWVLTDTMNEPAILACLGQAPELATRLHFCYVPHHPWHYDDRRRFWRWAELSPLRPLVHLSYLHWQRAAEANARALLTEVAPQLVHQLTFVGFRFPGRLWRLGLPFVWGPIGGLEDTPVALLGAMGWRGALYFGLRNVINALQRRWLSAPRQAARAAAALLAATSGNAALLRRCYGVDAQVLCEVTAPPLAPAILWRAPDEPLRLAWSGAHIPRKALPLLLRALAGLAPDLDWRLDIYGSGPRGAAWQRQAARLGLAPRCTWHGQVQRAEAISGLRRAHLFIITSLQDLTSTVLLEAMSQGLPVLCPDHCGFPDVVTPAAGMRLPIERPATFVAALRAALRRLAADEPERRRLGAGALARAGEYDLAAKAEALRQVYQGVLATADITGNPDGKPGGADALVTPIR